MGAISNIERDAMAWLKSLAADAVARGVQARQDSSVVLLLAVPEAATDAQRAWLCSVVADAPGKAVCCTFDAHGVAVLVVRAFIIKRKPKQLDLIKVDTEKAACQP